MNQPLRCVATTPNVTTTYRSLPTPRSLTIMSTGRVRSPETVLHLCPRHHHSHHLHPSICPAAATMNPCDFGTCLRFQCTALRKAKIPWSVGRHDHGGGYHHSCAGVSVRACRRTRHRPLHTNPGSSTCANHMVRLYTFVLCHE